MEWAGMIAAFCTTVSFIPQVLVIFKGGGTQDISLGMYILFVTGILFWLIYGIVLGLFPITLANAITFMLSGLVLVYKIRNIYKGNDPFLVPSFLKPLFSWKKK